MTHHDYPTWPAIIATIPIPLLVLCGCFTLPETSTPDDDVSDDDDSHNDGFNDDDDFTDDDDDDTADDDDDTVSYPLQIPDLPGVFCTDDESNDCSLNESCSTWGECGQVCAGVVTMGGRADVVSGTIATTVEGTYDGKPGPGA